MPDRERGENENRAIRLAVDVPRPFELLDRLAKPAVFEQRARAELQCPPDDGSLEAVEGRMDA